MSATMKLAKEFHELDVGQPTAECPLVCPCRRTLVTRCKHRPAQGGAEDTEERVLALMESSGTFRAEQKTPRSVSWRLEGFLTVLAFVSNGPLLLGTVLSIREREWRESERENERKSVRENVRVRSHFGSSCRARVRLHVDAGKTACM